MPGKLAKKGQLVCLLCKSPLVESTAFGLWLHPPVAGCTVAVTDSDGVSVDEQYEVVDGVIYEREVETETLGLGQSLGLDLLGLGEPTATESPLGLVPVGALTRRNASADFTIEFQRFYSHDKAINELFEQFGQPKLGGASGDLGWSSFSAFQRCPYLWYRNYMAGARAVGDDIPLALIVGSLVHLYLALHYQRIIDPNYPITPDAANGYFLTKGVNTDGLKDAWRLFEAYRLFYVDDYLKPLAVEYHTVDPKTGESCRYDLIAEVVEDTGFLTAGAYVIEHKTAGRFSDDQLTGWVNDGEVIGQIMLWERLKLHKRFGELKGVVVNILGKQKEPLFHRTLVSPNRWQTKQHARDLRAWEAWRQLCVAMRTFPRSRANCVSKFGKCSQWDHCATGEG